MAHGLDEAGSTPWGAGQPHYPVSAQSAQLAPAVSAFSGAKKGEGSEDCEYEHVSVNLKYTGEITRIEVGPEGLPCYVEVRGNVFNTKGKSQGTFTATFPSCPTFQPLPSTLGGNIYGIPAGTVMPAWTGQVDYVLKSGAIYTYEQAFIFPTSSEANSPLGVLSTADVTGGTKEYKGATGSIRTPDGYDGAGSLLGDLYLPED